MGKREIARYKQFLLFPQCFQKACFPGASKGVIVWEWVTHFTSQHYVELEQIKSISDNKLFVFQVIKIVCAKVEKIVGRGKKNVTGLNLDRREEHKFKTLQYQEL